MCVENVIVIERRIIFLIVWKAFIYNLHCIFTANLPNTTEIDENNKKIKQ